MAKYDIYVVGMREEMFVDEAPGSDSFDMVPSSNTKYRLFCKTFDGREKFTITVWTELGWCGSGYTTASWGRMAIERVTEFGPATHLPKAHKLKLEGATYDTSRGAYSADINNRIVFDELDNDQTELDDADIRTNVFSYLSDGGDGYYPMGYACVNHDFFDELPRAFKERPVWIFSGASGLGKSTIGRTLSENGKVVYETDSANNGVLPKEIWADIIVVGNKWKNVTVEEVKKHLPKDCKAVDVSFTM